MRQCHGCPMGVPVNLLINFIVKFNQREPLTSIFRDDVSRVSIKWPLM